MFFFVFLEVLLLSPPGDVGAFHTCQASVCKRLLKFDDSGFGLFQTHPEMALFQMHSETDASEKEPQKKKHRLLHFLLYTSVGMATCRTRYSDVLPRRMRSIPLSPRFPVLPRQCEKKKQQNELEQPSSHQPPALMRPSLSQDTKPIRFAPLFPKPVLWKYLPVKCEITSRAQQSGNRHLTLANSLRSVAARFSRADFASSFFLSFKAPMTPAMGTLTKRDEP